MLMYMILRPLRLWAPVIVLLFSVSTTWAQGSAPKNQPNLTLVPYASGFTNPVHITHAGDGSQRLFIVEQGGRIRIIKEQALLDRPFLDITKRVSCCNERGLLSVAFPPGYSNKRYFYVNYTDTVGNTVIARYHLTSNPDVADPDSEELLLPIAQPYMNHNGGQIAFGPDGYLYIGMGDGGSGGDPQNNGQNLGTLLGKMLRIDVESNRKPYAIPPNNPFLAVHAARGEIWALGLRNPWRFSFDRQTGDLYIGDVGQNAYEEINFQRRSSAGGENYGWRVAEGNHCYNANTCDLTQFTPPVLEYPHAQGCSVTGGIVYRGQQFPRLHGTYLYGDFCSGRIWGVPTPPQAQNNTQLFKSSYVLSTFGEDEAGEVYLADYAGGTIYHLTDTADIDLEITNSDNPDPVAVGETLTYSLTITNKGGAPATQVQMTTTLPSELILVSVTSTQGTCSGTSTISCALDTINPQATVTVTLVTRSTVTGGLNLTATVTSNERETNSGNNTATAVTTVADAPPPNPSGPDLTGTWQSLTQSCKGSGATSKCKLRGTFLTENRGSQKAPVVSLRFYLSQDTSFDTSDTLLKDLRVSRLKSNKAKAKKLKASLATGSSASGQTVIAVLDVANTVHESNEANNTIVSPPLP
jgi:uncharacterized repeat protein (TIGR01451 family)